MSYNPFPTIRFGKGRGQRHNTCDICMVEIQEADLSCTHTNCENTFHRECLADWHQSLAQDGRVTTCPFCRGALNRAQVERERQQELDINRQRQLEFELHQANVQRQREFEAQQALRAPVLESWARDHNRYYDPAERTPSGDQNVAHGTLRQEVDDNRYYHPAERAPGGNQNVAQVALRQSATTINYTGPGPLGSHRTDPPNGGQQTGQQAAGPVRQRGQHQSALQRALGNRPPTPTPTAGLDFIARYGLNHLPYSTTQRMEYAHPSREAGQGGADIPRSSGDHGQGRNLLSGSNSHNALPTIWASPEPLRRPGAVDNGRAAGDINNNQANSFGGTRSDISPLSLPSPLPSQGSPVSQRRRGAVDNGRIADNINNDQANSFVGTSNNYSPLPPPGYAPLVPPGYAPSAPSGYAPLAPPGYAPSAPSGYAPLAPPGYAPSAPSGYAPLAPPNSPSLPLPNYTPFNYPPLPLPNYPSPYAQQRRGAVDNGRPTDNINRGGAHLSSANHASNPLPPPGFLPSARVAYQGIAPSRVSGSGYPGRNSAAPGPHDEDYDGADELGD